MAALLGRQTSFFKSAWFQGELYWVEDYPGAIPSKKSANRVKGEVYRLKFSGYFLKNLDRYEECTQAHPKPHEYRREITTVQLKNGKKIRAWIYLYNRPVNNLKRIPTGDFIKIRSL